MNVVTIDLLVQVHTVKYQLKEKITADQLKTFGICF